MYAEKTEFNDLLHPGQVLTVVPSLQRLHDCLQEIDQRVTVIEVGVPFVPLSVPLYREKE